ncbi:helix-turn-helix domain-containing protein [Shewanella sp. SM23]|uniref:helix-turn-helix domain-containing protein n=1 Tax=Shewanella sp. SM23 TaxID=2912794 RepID=UPI0021D97746|nr:helix-turn-helix transcriptional regulator [Shewanella sp. SM23]MCU8085469.1 helix-turn-helix domain-containing protein [Shewanella sp. SM23]
MDKTNTLQRNLLSEIDIYCELIITTELRKMGIEITPEASVDVLWEQIDLVLSNLWLTLGRELQPNAGNHDTEWIVGESVKEWIERRVRDKQYTYEVLPEITGLSGLTIKKLKSSEEYFLYLHKNTEDNLSQVLGNYGYPSAIQTLIRLAKIRLSSSFGQIIKTIIDREDDKIALLRKQIPSLETHIARQWLFELQKIINGVGVKLSNKLKALRSDCDVGNIIRLALLDGETRLQRHLGIDDARTLKNEIEKSFFAEVERLNTNILQCKLKKDIPVGVLNFEKAQIEQEVWEDIEGSKRDFIEKINRFCSIYEFYTRIKKESDLVNKFDECSYSRKHCDFCDPSIGVFADNNNFPSPFDLHIEREYSFDEIKETRDAGFSTSIKEVKLADLNLNSCKILYLTTQCKKKFGALRTLEDASFRIPFSICRHCAENFSSIIVEPVSSILRQIRSKWGVSQKAIASELKVNQGIISRLENDKIPFVDPFLLNRLYGLYFLGTLSEQQFMGRQERFYIYELLKELEMSGFERSRISVGYKSINPSSRYLKSHGSIGSKMECCCDALVRDDTGKIRIACFLSGWQTHEAHVLIAAGHRMRATHVYFFRHVCLDIRTGHSKVCSLPFNKSFMVVRSLNERKKYAELDRALLRVYGLESMINDFEYASFSFNTERFRSGFRSYDLENLSPGSINPMHTTKWYFSSLPRIEYGDGMWLRYLKDYSLDFLLIPISWEESARGKFSQIGAILQEEIYRSIFSGFKRFNEVMDDYEVDKEVVDCWINHWKKS